MPARAGQDMTIEEFDAWVEARRSVAEGRRARRRAGPRDVNFMNIWPRFTPVNQNCGSDASVQPRSNSLYVQREKLNGTNSKK